MPLDTYTPIGGNAEGDVAGLRQKLADTRSLSRWIAEPLTEEDQIVQAMEDASPTKWHLAHTTWFFEEMVLKPHDPAYRIFDERFNYCFNSYYENAGSRHPRPKRSLLTRPTNREVVAYRDHVDGSLDDFLGRGNGPSPEALSLIELGVHHEQQHQELMFSDCLAAFAGNPLRPAYREEEEEAAATGQGGGAAAKLQWVFFPGGIFQVGHGGDGFAYDNETPRHDQLPSR